MANDVVEFYMPTLDQAFHVLEEWTVELIAEGHEPDIKTIVINPLGGRVINSVRVRVVLIEDPMLSVEALAHDLRDIVMGTWSAALRDENRAEWDGQTLHPITLDEAAGFRVLKALPNAEQ